MRKVPFCTAERHDAHSMRAGRRVPQSRIVLALATLHGALLASLTQVR